MRQSADTLIAPRPRRLLYRNLADGSTISNPGAATPVLSSLTYTLPKDSLYVGAVLAITTDFTVQGASTNTTRFRLMGGATSATVWYDCVAKANAGTGAAQVRIIFNLTCRSIGASGTVMVIVPEFFLAAAIASEPASLATIDTTVANVLCMEYTPSVLNGNISCIPRDFKVEALN